MHKHFYKTNEMYYHRKKYWVADNQLFKFSNVTETGCCKILLMQNNLLRNLINKFCFKGLALRTSIYYLYFEINSLKADSRSFMCFTYIQK